MQGIGHIGNVRARWCTATIVLLASLISGQTTSVAPQPLTVEGASSYVYKTVGKDQLRLHVFKPNGAYVQSQKPAIVFFFGGAWTRGSVLQFVPQAKYFAERGMVAVVADYRVFARHGTTPFEGIADAKSTVRWMRAHAAQLGIDPNRIVASGGSSGGHIALSAAVFDTFDESGEDMKVSSKPNALVLFDPALVLLNPGVDVTNAAPPAILEQFSNRRREGSPLYHVRAGLPPTLILHGKSDIAVPYSDVERYCAEAKAYGNQCQLVGYESAPHGFYNPDRAEGKWYRETLLEADRFLTRIGYLPMPAPTQTQ